MKFFAGSGLEVGGSCIGSGVLPPGVGGPGPLDLDLDPATGTRW